MKKIIISGAGGFVGASLVKRLLIEDVHIWTIEKNYKENTLPDSSMITRIRDNSDIEELKDLLSNDEYDLFYNLAWNGVNGPDKGKYDIQIDNLKLTLNYAELAKAIGCKEYLCAGTIAERSIESLHALSKTTDGMMYSAAKYCGRVLLETYCKNIGLDFVWMQFSNIYGPNNRTGNLISYTIEQLKKNSPACFGPALQPYDFLYIDDLIEAICRLGLVATKDNFYYIGSGHPRILRDYLETIGEIYGRPDLIHIGERGDDGIRYTYEAMDSLKTITDIGNYVSDSFENHIRYTLDNY